MDDTPIPSQPRARTGPEPSRSDPEQTRSRIEATPNKPQAESQRQLWKIFVDGPAARRELFNFHTSSQGPHLPILSRRLGRKHLSPDLFWKKKMARVPKPAKTSKIFLAPGHELTFPSHVQDLIEKIAATHILKKTSTWLILCAPCRDLTFPH